MKNKREGHLPMPWVIIIVIGFISVAYFVYRSANPNQRVSYNQPTPTNKQSSGQLYRSRNLKFSLQVPPDWQIQEDITFVNLISSEGKINISRIATNFDDVESYLKDFDSKRNIKVIEENNLKIDKHNSIVRVEMFNGGPISEQKAYFVYINNWVYSLSATSEALFDDLDTIAQSFKYTP